MNDSVEMDTKKATITYIFQTICQNNQGMTQGCYVYLGLFDGSRSLILVDRCLGKK